VLCITLSWDLQFLSILLCPGYLGPLTILCFFLWLPRLPFDVKSYVAYQFICFDFQFSLANEIWNYVDYQFICFDFQFSLANEIWN